MCDCGFYLGHVKKFLMISHTKSRRSGALSHVTTVSMLEMITHRPSAWDPPSFKGVLRILPNYMIS